MTAAFDQYDRSYQQVVQDSIAFSGIEHAFFLEAKARLLARVFSKHFGDRKPALADIGCGVGKMHPLLAPLCSSIAGCDPSAHCIAEAERNNKDVTYAASTGDELPWAGARFDAALAVCVFHHVVREARAKLVAEMRRIVRPGGLVIIIEHNPWNPATRLAVARCPFDHDAVLLDWRNCTRMLRDGGLAEVSSEHFLMLPTFHRAAGAIERAFAKAPIGAQYLATGVVSSGGGK